MSYKEVEGQIQLSIEEMVRAYPMEFAEAKERIVRADLLEQGVYVPSESEKLMMFLLGLGAIVGITFIRSRR